MQGLCSSAIKVRHIEQFYEELVEQYYLPRASGDFPKRFSKAFSRVISHLFLRVFSSVLKSNFVPTFGRMYIFFGKK